jgi:hypothetical protein
MAQGFVKSLNLLESGSESDAGIFENIGGAGIVPDLQLFSGNLRKTSVLEANSYVTDGNTIVITGDGRVPFSNRTVVTEDGVSYTVTKSDGLTTFELRDSSNAPYVPTGDLVRSDAVTFDNLENMSVSRLSAIRDSGSSGGGVSVSSGEESGIYDLRSISGNYDIIEEGLGIYFYKKSRIPRTFEDSSFNRRLTFSGNIRITNDSNVTQSSTSPGLFIKGPTGSVRAFSDTSNPWTENSSGTKLQTTSNNASIYDLVLNDPNLIVPSSELNAETVVTDAEDYTHKMKIEVDGETFYALLVT